MKIKTVKLPKSSFLERVISNEDYVFFKRRLRREKDLRWYFIVWTLAATGARISELVQLKAEHVRTGYYDIYSKGEIIRRIYLPVRLRTELLKWMDRDTGYLFVNRYGRKITPRGIAQNLKIMAEKYGIDPTVVHPHSFRHLYAKNFLSKSQRPGDAGRPDGPRFRGHDPHLPPALHPGAKPPRGQYVGLVGPVTLFFVSLDFF